MKEISDYIRLLLKEKIVNLRSVSGTFTHSLQMQQPFINAIEQTLKEDSYMNNLLNLSELTVLRYPLDPLFPLPSKVVYAPEYIYAPLIDITPEMIPYGYTLFIPKPPDQQDSPYQVLFHRNQVLIRGPEHSARFRVKDNVFILESSWT